MLRDWDWLAGFLRALGVPGQDIPADEAERTARYRSLLAGKHVLIVLDNTSNVGQVRLLPGTPDCAVVLTSRDSLAGLVARDGAARLDLACCRSRTLSRCVARRQLGTISWRGAAHWSARARIP